jgi:translation initiation factor IF-3
LAQEADLDLVEVAPTARPPVCKLMDYGKFKYESALKARESRKNQAQTVIKEIKLRPKIDPHDYGTKKGHVERFLKAGDKVKVTIMFRGREQSRPELGFRLLQRLAGDVEELGFVEAQPKQDGRNMTMVIGPHRKKSDARAERVSNQAAPAERSHAERPERAPQTERVPQSQRPVAEPARVQVAPAAQAAPAEAAPVQAAPVQAAPVQAAPVQAAPVQAAPAQAAPVQAAPAQAAPRPVPAQAVPRPAPARPAPRPAPARPAPRPAPAQPAAAQPAPQPAERAPAARPVPGPRAVHAAAARRANGGQETKQPGQEVPAS